MKILCDDCGKQEASVFCCADEAALCDGCDRRVHRANKLAGKHRRFMLNSDIKSPPLCDICREKHAFIFCQEDRAILCIDCNTSIHGANNHTMKHTRFVLTGVQLSSSTVSYPETTESEAAQPKATTTPQNYQSKTITQSKTVKSTNTTTTPVTSADNSESGSSISEYLTKTCPGWHVEDLLVDEYITTVNRGFSEVNELLPLFESNLDCSSVRPATEQSPIWVPHVPKFSPQTLSSVVAGCTSVHYQPANGDKEVGMRYQNGGLKLGRQERSEDVFMVPQIPSPVSNTSKRARHSVWY